VIVFVGHTLLLSRISLDVDNVANTVGNQVSRELDHAMIYAVFPVNSDLGVQPEQSYRTLELALEHVARTRAVTEGVRHLDELYSEGAQ
jgi:hypothetical protein